MSYRVTYQTSDGHYASHFVENADNVSDAISKAAEQCLELKLHPSRIKRVIYSENP